MDFNSDGHADLIMGTFSKSLIPALRVGYLVAPLSLQQALREARRVSMWEGDVVTHGALADFIAEGHHSAHVRRASRVYGERRSQLLAELSRLAHVEQGKLPAVLQHGLQRARGNGLHWEILAQQR